MAMGGVQIAVGGLLLGTAALAGTGIWYLSTGRLVPLLEEDGYSESYKENNIGKKYGRYFLSSKNNQEAWEERYRKYKSKFKSVSTGGASSGSSADQAKDKFSTVTKDYGGDSESTALNQVCKSAYTEKTASNLVETNPSSEIVTQFVKRYIWEFCGLYELVTVDEDKTNYSNIDSNIGGDTTNKKLFVSAKDSKNDWFWKIRAKEFWGKGERDHSNGEGKEQEGNEFKALKATQNHHWTKFRDACHTVFYKPTTDDTNDSKKNKSDAVLFCSIKLSIS